MDEHGKSTTDEEGNVVVKNKEKQQIVLFNHLRFSILMHEDPKKGTRRVVGFEVEPFRCEVLWMASCSCCVLGSPRLGSMLANYSMWG